jgi:N-acyl-D-amino-acid deacylase
MKFLITATLLAAAIPGLPGAGLSDRFYAGIRANDLHQITKMLQEGADVNTRDDRGVTPLMYAATIGSLDAMKLLLNRDANPNLTNMFGSTALMWSATDIGKVRLLLDHGADARIVSKQGRTALQIAALSDRSAEIVRLLIGKGANVKTVDQMGMTTLMAASLGNDTETIRLLLEAGVDVNASGPLMAADAIVGETALMTASANGNLAAVRLLLAKGARVDPASSRDKLFQVKHGSIALGGFTALSLAAAYGPPEVVRTLLDAGASPDTKDVRGFTALKLAMDTDRRSPEIVRILAAQGDRPASTDKTTEAPRPDASPTDAKTAVERSLRLLETSSAQFFHETGCVACHAQNMTDMAAAVARNRGVRVDESAASERVKMAQAIFGPFAPMLLERIDAPGGGDTVAYSLTALAASGYAPDRMTDAMAANLAAQQRADGSWHIGGWTRPPMEDGDFSRTALAIRALKAFGPAGRAAEMSARVELARHWLSAAKPTTTEDHNMKLLGLHWAAEDHAALDRLSSTMIAAQRADGGWGQRPDLPSDAYATGQSLYALAEAGCIDPAAAVYQKGVGFLLSTQQPDGSWHVRSRALKFQPYFESSFPYGDDQWISATATAWAAMAIARSQSRNTPSALAASTPYSTVARPPSDSSHRGLH